MLLAIFHIGDDGLEARQLGVIKVKRVDGTQGVFAAPFHFLERVEAFLLFAFQLVAEGGVLFESGNRPEVVAIAFLAMAALLPPIKRGGKCAVIVAKQRFELALHCFGGIRQRDFFFGGKQRGSNIALGVDGVYQPVFVPPVLQAQGNAGLAGSPVN